MEHLVKIAAKLFGSTLIRYFLLAGIPFIIFYVFSFRRYSRSKIQERSAAKKDFTREIFHSVLSSLILSIEAALVLFTPLRQHTLLYKNLSDYPYWWIPVSLGDPAFRCGICCRTTARRGG